MPENIDHGWAWVVCFATCTLLFLETGTVKALGVVLPVLRQQFASKTWIIGLIISLSPGIGAVTCPLAGALSKRFSAQYTVMLFSMISAMGLVLGSMASSVQMLSICFVMNGFSMGAEAIASGELARYFDKYYSVVNALSRASVQFGIKVMPLLAQFLIDVYGWRGTMLILGGLNLHCIAAGAIFRPTEHIEEEDVIYVIKTSEKSSKYFETKTLIYYLDLHLFLNPVFIARFVHFFGNGACLSTWLIYLVPFAMEAGLTPYRAASLATFGGIGGLVVIGTYPLILKIISDEHFLYSAAVCACMSLASYPVWAANHTYTGLVVSSVVYGFARISALLVGYQMVKEAFSDDEITNAMMWLFVSYSIGCVTGGVLSGWVHDQTGSYTLSFIIVGALAVLSVSPQPFVKRTVPDKENEGVLYSALSTKEESSNHK